MKTVHWYFDFISPFAYLQSHRLDDFAQHAVVHCKPVLLAGILAHHGHKGPAEIPAKRGWTYEHALWLARRDRVPMRLPPAHPFNPLPLLRLSVLLGSRISDVRRLFDYVWVQGHLPADEAAWRALLQELGADEADLQSAQVKEAVRRNTEEAIAAGVFGVPTAVVDGRLIWGYDATDMVQARVSGDPFFDSPEVAAAHALPIGAQRRV